MAEFIGIFVGTALFYIVCDGLGQRNMGRLIVICGVLSFLMFINPYIQSAKIKANEMRQDVQQFTKAIDNVGNSINKVTQPLGELNKGIGKIDKNIAQQTKETKDKLKELEEKTKVPGLDKIDKDIENWWSQLLGGKEKKK